MLFPPSPREAVLSEVRGAITDHLAKMCSATREAHECVQGGQTGADFGEWCRGCPLQAVAPVAAVLDRLARK